MMAVDAAGIRLTKGNSHEYFGVTVLKGNHSEIQRIKKQSDNHTHHGNKIWKSSLLLIDYLQSFPVQQKLRVLEVGCGWGLTSIFCAKHFQANVTAVDIDPYVFPFLNLHARINEVVVETRTLDFDKITGKVLTEYDLLLGSDICFWDDMRRPLFNLIRRAQKAGVRSIVTDPGREPFNLMAGKCEDKLSALLDHWSIPHPHNGSGTIVDVPASV